MTDLAIFGMGGFGREMELMIRQINAVNQRFRFVGYFDDNKTTKEWVLGNTDDLNRHNHPIGIIVAVADPFARKSIVGRISNPLVNYPSLIHPMTSGGEACTIGRGSIITAGCVLTTNIVVGDFVIVNLMTSIGHDARLGDFASVMPGVHVSGNVRVGEACLIGTGAKILQDLTIGDSARVGAGAVVTKDVMAGTTVIGVPAKIIGHA